MPLLCSVNPSPLVKAHSFLFPLKDRIPPGKGIPKQQPLKITLPPFSWHSVIHRGWSTCKVLQLFVSLATSFVYWLLTISIPRLPRSLLPKCFIRLVPLSLRPRNKPFSASRFHNLVKHILDPFLKKEKQKKPHKLVCIIFI